MPKDLGTETTTRKRVRSIDNFLVSIRPGGDMLDIAPVVELRDPDNDDALAGVQALPPSRFSEAEMRAILDAEEPPITELPDYDTLRLGLAKLMHALLDTRP